MTDPKNIVPTANDTARAPRISLRRDRLRQLRVQSRVRAGQRMPGNACEPSPSLPPSPW
jgi:hypothetical protein